MAILTETFNGIPAGMNLAKPAFELGDNEARYLQDVLLDQPGLVRMRGPVTPAAGFPTLPNKASGIFGTLNPAGNYRLAAIDGNTTNSYIRLLNNTFSSYVTFNWSGAMPTAPTADPYRIVDSKPALTGGVFIGTSSQYNTGVVQNLGLWRGGNSADYTTGTITLTRQSATVTGSGTSWTANASPGMFLFATFDDGTAGVGKATMTYIGVVKSVDSNTQLTLGAVALYPRNNASLGTLSYTLTSVRGLVAREVKGRVTAATSSATLTGANTKFQSGQIENIVLTTSASTTNASAIITGLSSTTSLKVGMRVQGTNVGTAAYIISIDSSTQITVSANSSATGATTLTIKHGWNFYRASDLQWIGRLSVVNNDISITLAANAAVAMNNERFIAFNMTGDWAVNTLKTGGVGFLNATYAQRQWYANNGTDASTMSRVWFSDPADPEGLDLAAYDGDFIDIASSIGTDTPIKAIIPAYNSLVVIKENETFAIYGTTPTTFSVKKIEDDGALCGMSAMGYGGGAVWAGREGIHFYDGITVNNLSSGKLGEYYKNALTNFVPSQYRMWATVIREHYILFIENLEPNAQVIKGTTVVTPSALTVVINMATQAFSMFTNLPLRGATETPSDTGKNVLYIINDEAGGNICSGDALFDEIGKDTLVGDSGTSATIYDYGQTSTVSTVYGTATAFNVTGDKKYVSQITITADCNLESIRAYMKGQGGGSATTNVKAVLYTDSSGSPDALLQESSVAVVTQADQDQFVNFSFSSLPAVAAGTYWIGIHVETSGRAMAYKFSTANLTKYNSDTYVGGAANPFGAASNDTGPLVIFARVKTAGPDFYIESKKYTQDDAMRKKLFKQLAINYLVQGDSLRLDTVPGLNDLGRTSSSTFPTSVFTWTSLTSSVATWAALSALYSNWEQLINSVYRPKRIKFLKRTQMLSFRIWANSPSVTAAQLGPFQIGYKLQRAGRI